MLQEFNTVAPKLKFTLELEENNKTNFLDINIIKHQNKMETVVYLLYSTIITTTM
jgi:hypothetical protein